MIEGEAVTGELDALVILHVLVAHGVDMVVVGGLAVAHHGFVRATKDVDVVPRPEPANMRSLWEALTTIGARPLSLGDFRSEELPAPFSLESLLLGGNWDLATRHGRLDILRHIEGALETDDDYARLRRNAEAAVFDFGTVWFAGYEDLLDLKTIAGRGQDLVDIRALREARGDTRPNGSG
jgi:hypothetical protein